MEITNQVAYVGAVLFDTNGTLVSCDEYVKEGRSEELKALAKELGLSVEPESIERSIRMAAWAWQDAMERIDARTGRRATAMQVVRELGLSGTWWVGTATRCYRPERWIFADNEMSSLVGKVADSCEVGVVSSHAYHVTSRMLTLLGFNHFLGRIRVFGPEIMDVSKVDPDHWMDVSSSFKLAPKNCLFVTDNEAAAHAAAQVDMMVMRVDGPSGTKKTCEELLAAKPDLLAT